jgi:hypothetical protein
MGGGALRDWKKTPVRPELSQSWTVRGFSGRLLMWQLNIATLIRFFTAVLLAPCGATAKHGNYYSGKFMFFKLEKKYLLAGVISKGKFYHFCCW